MLTSPNQFPISLLSVPSAIYQAVRVINATQLQWIWSPPSDNPRCVANYRVNLTGPTQRDDHKSSDQLTNETFMLFKDLEPCGIYELEIVPISLNGTLGGTFVNQSTLSEDRKTTLDNAM